MLSFPAEFRSAVNLRRSRSLSHVQQMVRAAAREAQVNAGIPDAQPDHWPPMRGVFDRMRQTLLRDVRTGRMYVRTMDWHQTSDGGVMVTFEIEPYEVAMEPLDREHEHDDSDVCER